MCFMWMLAIPLPNWRNVLDYAHFAYSTVAGLKVVAFTYVRDSSALFPTEDSKYPSHKGLKLLGGHITFWSLYVKLFFFMNACSAEFLEFAKGPLRAIVSCCYLAPAKIDRAWADVNAEQKMIKKYETHATTALDKVPIVHNKG